MSGPLYAVCGGLKTLFTYDNTKSVRQPQKEVANMLAVIGHVANAAAVYFGASKLLALGYTKAAYATVAAGFYTNAAVALMLGAAYLGTLAYARLAPVVKEVVARNFANVATKNTGIGALEAYGAWMLVSAETFEKSFADGGYVDQAKATLPYFNVVGDFISAQAHNLAQVLVTKKKEDTVE